MSPTKFESDVLTGIAELKTEQRNTASSVFDLAAEVRAHRDGPCRAGAVLATRVAATEGNTRDQWAAINKIQNPGKIAAAVAGGITSLGIIIAAFVAFWDKIATVAKATIIGGP